MARPRVALTPLRRHLAAVLTIALSCAFVAVMVLAGNLVQDSLRSQAAQVYDGADLEITRQISEVDYASVDPLPAPEVDGVEAVWPLPMTYVEASTGSTSSYVEAVMLPAGEDLAEGAAAASPSQIVLGRSAADALDLDVGDTLTLSTDDPADTDGTAEFEIAGIAKDPTGSVFGSVPRLLLQDVNAAAVLGPTQGTLTPRWLASVPDGADPAAVAAAARSAQGGEELTVRTAEEAQDEAADDMLRGFAAMGLLLSVFVLIALFTSAVVIANTFAVTLAQRTRSLALLRTLGATRAQVRTVVLRESLLVGLLGAGIGVVLGHLLVQAGLALAAAVGWLDGVAPVPISVLSVLLPVLAGVAITLLASLAPLRAATRVAPLQALRPVPSVGAHDAGSRRLTLRGATGLLAVAVGLLALAGGTVLALRGTAGPAILLAMAGGVLSFLGVMLVLVVLTRPLAALAARAAALLGGLPARIAGANVARTPRRSAATIAALLIGTTLMTMMAVGARTAEATLTAELDSRRPIDLVLSAEQMPDDAVGRIAAIQGMDTARAAERGDIEMGADDPMTLFGVDPDAVREVSHRPGVADVLEDGVVVLGQERAERFGVRDGKVLTLDGADGTPQELRVHVEANLQMSLVTPATLTQLVGDAASPAVLADFADPGSAARGDVGLQDLKGAIGEATTEPGFVDVRTEVGGAERESYAQILDVLLGITIALLAVAVLVALVGVANTLSLGVVERTRENALLRALGTTRRQTRAMLGWEGLLLAAVGAILGLLLGSVYGVLGIVALLGSTFPVSITIPWSQLVLVLVLALASGVLASVLPGRAAARTAPAAALAGSD